MHMDFKAGEGGVSLRGCRGPLRRLTRFVRARKRVQWLCVAPRLHGFPWNHHRMLSSPLCCVQAGMCVCSRETREREILADPPVSTARDRLATMPLTILPPLPPWAPFSYQTLFTLAVLLVTSYLALKAAIRRPMELAKDHWSRNPDKCKSKPSRVTHKLSCDWVYENSKKTSDLVCTRCGSCRFAHFDFLSGCPLPSSPTGPLDWHLHWPPDLGTCS